MTTKTSRLSLQWLHHLPEQKQIIERTQKSVSAYTGVSFDCQLDDFVVNMFLTDDYALHSFFFSLGVQVFAATRWRHCTFFYELINGIGGHWSPCCFPWSWSFAWSLRGLRNRIVRAESNGRIVSSEGLMCRRISGLGRCLWWTWRQVPFIGAEALWSQVGGFWQQLTVCIIRRRIS